jgi:hypothetical protein
MLSILGIHGLKRPLSRGSREREARGYFGGSRSSVSIFGVKDVPTRV